MENKTVILEIEDDAVVVEYNGEKSDIQEFICENGGSLSYDCSYYGEFNEVTYRKLCSEIEEEFKVDLDWNDVESIYFAAASEAIEFFRDELTELGYTVKYDSRLILTYSPQEAAAKLKAEIAERESLKKLKNKKYSQLTRAIQLLNALDKEKNDERQR